MSCTRRWTVGDAAVYVCTHVCMHVCMYVWKYVCMSGLC
jgi:hypothetical protein